MLPNLDDDNFMRRFLVGEVSQSERDLVEERFMTDSTYFEALEALEDELILDYLRGELPEPWLKGFKARILDSPGRQKRVEDMRAFVTDLRIADRAIAEDDRRTNWAAWWTLPRLGIVATCAAVLATVVVGWRLSTRAPGAIEPATTVVSETPGPIAVATFVLAPGLTRSELRQANVFRVPAGVNQINLELTIPGAVPARVGARLRRVGGSDVNVPREPAVEATPSGAKVTWPVPLRLPRGDYLLTITPTTAPGGEPLATRFFTIDE